MAASSKDGHPGSSTTSHFSRRWLAPQAQSWARVAIVLLKPNFQDNSSLTQFQSSRAGILIYRPCYGRVRNAAVLMPDVDEGNKEMDQENEADPTIYSCVCVCFFSGQNLSSETGARIASQSTIRFSRGAQPDPAGRSRGPR